MNESPEQRRIREHIQVGMCPYCSRGPFVVLPGHTSRAHGIDRWALRDAAGLTTRDRISSPEFVDACRRRAIELDFVSRVQEAMNEGPRRWTKTGKENSVSAMQEGAAKRSPESRSEGSRKANTNRGTEHLSAMHAAQLAQYRQLGYMTAERRAEIVPVIIAEALSIPQIQTRFCVSPKQAQRLLTYANQARAAEIGFVMSRGRHVSRHVEGVADD